MDMHHQYARVLSRGGDAPGVEHVANADVLTPADRYQELFVAVQTARPSLTASRSWTRPRS